jgi:predicted  nucleic acid-binding Zn-ribbon protein
MASQNSDRASQGETIQKNRCRNCHSYVSQQFARVFGTNDDTVHACIECSTLHALREGDGGCLHE